MKESKLISIETTFCKGSEEDDIVEDTCEALEYKESSTVSTPICPAITSSNAVNNRSKLHYNYEPDHGHHALHEHLFASFNSLDIREQY